MLIVHSRLRESRFRLLFRPMTLGLLFVLLTVRPAAALGPEGSAAVSLLVPGLGQIINDEPAAGAAHLGVYLVFARQYGILSEREDYIEEKDREDTETNTIRTNRTTHYADLYLSAAVNVSLYSSFGAYRDARNAMGNGGYVTPAPQETLGELAVAPFQFKYLSRPSTFIPLLVPLAFALMPADDERLVYQPEGSLTRSEMAQGFFVQHGFVAVGEETFFRGVLNNGLSDSLGNTWGLVTSSAIFGLAHSGTGGTATPAAASVFGLYVGWLHQQNEFQIGEGVALHFWWNFLTSLGFLQKRDAAQHVTLANFYVPF